MLEPAALDSLIGRTGVLAAAVIVLAAALCAKAIGRRRPEVHKRGVILRDTAARRYRLPLRISAAPAENGVTLAGIPIPGRDETKHFKIIGTTGTGKSTVIREILSAALARGDRAVIADPDGGYHARFFRRYRGDVLLNPFDAASVKWDPFSEISEIYDADQLASGLIPPSADPSANEWRAYARTFLAAVLRRNHSLGCRSSSELWRLLSAASLEELRPMVAATPAQPFLDGENARMFGSIRSVMVSAMAAFEYVQRQRAAPFSIRQWVRRSVPGVLFMTYKAGQISALRSMIATWMRLAIFEAMGAEEDRDQRLWIVIDELDALGAIDGLKDALARLRKFGGRCVLGFQSIAQVSGTYGSGDAQTITENCGNTLILRCSGSEHGGTSQFASRLIGEREVLRRQISRGSDRDGLWPRQAARRSKNVSEQHVTEAAVMASEIEQLPDLTGYLKPASSREWVKVAFGRPSSHRGAAA
ncbi:MAG TPA: type IV secretion system DNA-binding domain-containing protein [Steroidobacteraceae bacterium]|jgi:type IV secretory pathway TraG/TraD family ATPase VirD4|nr:type IV secretion system DNA-binding domain-containing protein [Steroidobacteraceae bacterium]